MHGRALISLLLMLTPGCVLFANPAEGDPRKEKLFSMFMAPCCWRGNLLAHDSPKSEELRAEIKALIAAGRTDEEIKRTFVDRYTTKILAIPEGAHGLWLWWTPIAALAAGLLAVGLYLRRSMKKRSEAELIPATALPDVPDTEWN